jgi:hypothetical protein
VPTSGARDPPDRLRAALPCKLVEELEQFNGEITQMYLSNEDEARLKHTFGVYKEEPTHH